nr:hypothetical protein [Planococcus glaciei]
MNKRFWQVSAIVSSGLAVAVAGVGIAASNRLMYVKKKRRKPHFRAGNYC